MNDTLLTDCYSQCTYVDRWMAAASDIESERDGEMVWDDMD